MNQRVKLYEPTSEEPKAQCHCIGITENKGIKCLVSQHKHLLVHQEIQGGAQRNNVFGSKIPGISHEVNEGRV